jgi:hypothetical protein
MTLIGVNSGLTITDRQPRVDEMEIPALTLDGLITFVKGQHPDGDALDRLSDAVLVAAHVNEQADNLIGHFVDQARRSGASWSQIGSSMGVTKQAAQKRFVPRWGDDLLGAGRTFDRFTDRARNVVVMANRLASGAGLAAITPAHLVAALHSEPEGFAAKALNEFGATPDVVAREVGVDHAPGEIVDSMAFDADTMRSLESALHEALRLRHNYIGTEHLLLGVLAQPELDVTRRLATLGVTTETFEPWTVDALEQHLAGLDKA